MLADLRMLVYTLPITSYDCCQNFRTIICAGETRKTRWQWANWKLCNCRYTLARPCSIFYKSNETVIRWDDIPFMLQKEATLDASYIN